VAVNPDSATQPRIAVLDAKAVRWILEGCNWLTATEVAERAGVHQTQLQQWLSDGTIFAVEWDGEARFASYLFGPDRHPVAGIATVLQILEGSSARSVAAWFESASSYLGGRRPRQLIATSPELVADAARDTVEAEQFAG